MAKRCTRQYEIIGSQFTEGVLSALRAYPQVQSVIHHPVGEDSLLLLTLLTYDEDGDTNLLKDVIVRAGGAVIAMRRIDDLPATDT